MPPAGLEPATSLVGGAAAENHDLESVLSSRTPLVFGLLIGLGFLLLLVAVGSRAKAKLLAALKTLPPTEVPA